MIKLMRLPHYYTVILLIISFPPLMAHALVNPDRPDPVEAFKSRAEPYEDKIESAQTTSDFADAYAAYNQFLEKEVESAYQKLINAVPKPRIDTLKQSHRQWEAFRDSELKFIRRNWTQDEFGSSAAISRGGFRARILENRTIMLLRYLQNY